MRFSVYQVSRKGGREKNEDRMGYCYTREAGLFALADGMGGHPEGETASQLSLQTMSALFQRDARPGLADPLRFLTDAIMAGHHQLLRYASEKGLIDTPRTTIVACIMQGNTAYWAHCGDSRLYLVRGDKLIAPLATTLIQSCRIPSPAWCPWSSATTATCCSRAWAAPASP